ncbi:MAG: hypothetical protein ACRD3T_01845 [Terriglobia bacterium]
MCTFIFHEVTAAVVPSDVVGNKLVTLRGDYPAALNTTVLGLELRIVFAGKFESTGVFN